MDYLLSLSSQVRTRLLGREPQAIGQKRPVTPSAAGVAGPQFAESGRSGKVRAGRARKDTAQLQGLQSGERGGRNQSSTAAQPSCAACGSPADT